MLNKLKNPINYIDYSLGEDEAARFLNMAETTLENLRLNGCGPRCEASDGQFVEYICSDLASWQFKRMFCQNSYIQELENALS